MSQDKIQITNTPPLPGTQLVQELNDAFEALATDFSGSVDPAAYSFAYSLWADTGTGDLKRRNAANSAWTKVGRIYPGVIEDASGNVGIGTSSPTAYGGFTVVEVGSTSGNAGLFSAKHANGNVLMLNEAGSARFGSAGAYPTVFLVESVERARIDSSGNLLVGTTSASVGGVVHKFVVNYATAGGVALSNTAGNTGGFINFYNTSGYAGGISQSGASVAYNTTSDYRLKENVAPMTGALATVAALKPCTYTWKADGSTGQGFIAHELQEVVPDCVTGEKDAVDAEGKPQYQGVDTSFLVGILTKAIQEQQTLITDLRAEFDAYKLSHP